MIAQVPLPQATHGEHAKRAAVVERVVEELRSQPGVVQAAARAARSSAAGRARSAWRAGPSPRPASGPPRTSPGSPPTTSRPWGSASSRAACSRSATATDAPAVCIVDETFARTHWPGESPLGKRVKFGGLDDADHPWMEVVGRGRPRQELRRRRGVAGRALPAVPAELGERVHAHRPHGRVAAGRWPRGCGRPCAPSTGSSRSTRSARSTRSWPSARPSGGSPRCSSASSRRWPSLLAAVGIYGVMSYAVAQRTQEIGIRMALGAEREHVLRMVLRSGTVLALSGIADRPRRPPSLSPGSSPRSSSRRARPTRRPSRVVPLLLLAVALVASYLPARRAARVDPMVGASLRVRRFAWPDT